LQKLAAFASFFDYFRAFCISVLSESALSMLHVKALPDASGCTIDATTARILGKTATEKAQTSENRKK